MENLEIDELKKKVQLYETILNNVSSGILITDPEGYVVFFSEAYGRFLNKDPKRQIGKYTTEAVENSRMHIVAKTGIAEINSPQRIKGQDMIVQRVPIYMDGKLVADDEASYRYLAESIRMHPDQEALKAMLAGAGFDKVDYFNLSAGVVALHRGFKY